MKELVELSITHFRFAIGGEHYYGNLTVREKSELITKDGRTFERLGGSWSRDKHPHHDTKLVRKVGAKEAAYLNKKDGETGMWGIKPGEETERFNDKETIEKVALKTFAALFDNDDLLVIKSEDGRYVYRARAGPQELVEELNRLEQTGTRDADMDQRKLLGDSGYLFKN